ncbi:hypothetical protein QG37_03685 [Candidozyma auris]|uniref:Uncharacterized protein n=1 Tax=Candidozyma auris TaxID=498019 RepID=A0A0L0P0R2_CANAR|nr:hypothetical protein QG37_03685 [[Candida] auris]
MEGKLAMGPLTAREKWMQEAPPGARGPPQRKKQEVGSPF